MATTKKKVAAAKPEAAKKHWFTDKKGSKGKEAYLKKHPNSRYHPANTGPPKPAQKTKTSTVKKSGALKAASERVAKYKELIKKGEAHYMKLGQRPKDSSKVQAWEANRKKVLDGIRKYKLAIRGAQSSVR